MTLSGDSSEPGADILQQVVNIVSAYVSHNAMRAVELPDFIGAVHSSIRQLSQEGAAVETKPPNVPAVPIKRSISKDFIICLEDGKKFKSLRRHLSSCYNMTPDEYRAKWGLPSDYPMVAPAYSATRSQLARDSGLGQISRGGEVIAEASAAEDAHEIAAEKAAAKEKPAKASVEKASVEKAPVDKASPAKDVVSDEPAKVDAAADATATKNAAEPSAPQADKAADDEVAGAATIEEAPKKPRRGRPRKVAA